MYWTWKHAWREARKQGSVNALFHYQDEPDNSCPLLRLAQLCLKNRSTVRLGGIVYETRLYREIDRAEARMTFEEDYRRARWLVSKGRLNQARDEVPEALKCLEDRTLTHVDILRGHARTVYGIRQAKKLRKLDSPDATKISDSIDTNPGGNK